MAGRTLAELAELVAAEVRGNGAREIVKVRSLDQAGPEDLAFLSRKSLLPLARKSCAGALLLETAIDDLEIDQLIVPAPERALAAILEELYPRRRMPAGIHPTAIVGEGCEIDVSAHVGPYAVLGSRCRLAAGVVVGAHSALGEGCTLGQDAVLHPHVVLYDGTAVGAGVILQSGTVIGGDGFGYASHQGVHHKIPHVGRVVLEDGVEVGANAAVDRATLEETRIGAGTKIDNLVQVGHNVKIGRASLLCGQAGIAGSAQLGDGVVVAGAAGISGHLEIGDGAQVAAAGVVLHNVEAGEIVGGFPALKIGKWRRQVVIAGKLDEMVKRLRRLEKAAREASPDGGEDPEGGEGE